LNWSIDLAEILFGGDAIAAGIDATTYDPIVSTTSKWLMFKVVRWMQYLHYSAMLNTGLGLFSIVDFHGYITYNL
jgi:hypothetical protein